jgi:hypothetical protein
LDVPQSAWLSSSSFFAAVWAQTTWPTRPWILPLKSDDALFLGFVLALHRNVVLSLNVLYEFLFGLRKAVDFGTLQALGGNAVFAGDRHYGNLHGKTSVATFYEKCKKKM